MTQSLPHTDEAIIATLKTLANNLVPACDWNGADTLLTSPMFGGFVRHANMYWFDSRRTFGYTPHSSTLGEFISQLRHHALRAA